MVVELDSSLRPVRSRVLIESSWDGHRNLSITVCRRLYRSGVTTKPKLSLVFYWLLLQLLVFAVCNFQLPIFVSHFAFLPLLLENKSPFHGTLPIQYLHSVSGSTVSVNMILSDWYIPLSNATPWHIPPGQECASH